MASSLPDVFNTLQIYLGSLYVNDFNLFGRTFRVTLQADKDARATPSDLSRLYVRNATGGMVPLSTLGTLRAIVGPETVPHYNNYASALINGGAAPGYSSGQAVAAMERAAAAALPRDFAFEWTGITFQELKAGSIATIVFALAIVFVFLILAAQYESWSMPFMVLLAVPLALFGAMLALWLRGRQIDVYSQIGFVMLIGLAAKNAILIVEFAKRRREDGLDIVEAAMDGGAPAPAADPDDCLRLHSRRRTADVRNRRRSGEPAVDRHHRIWRHARRHYPHPRLCPCLLCTHRAIAGKPLGPARSRTRAHRRPRRTGGMRLEFRIMQTWKIVLGTTALAAIAIAVVVVRQGDALFGGTAGAIPNPAAFAMPVPVANIVKKTIPISLDYSARTESIRNVSLQAKVSGFIQQQHIADGTDVKEGDLLYTIDPRDFQAALDQAKAQAQRNIAALEYARSNLDRGSTLAQSGFLAKDTLDQRSSAARQAEATLAMDQAAIRTAELNLSYTQIRAPFSGRLGRNQASVGTLIGTVGAALNTLVQLDPIYVTFNPSETDLAMIEKARAAGKVMADVLLPGETQARHSGELTFIDNAVDRSTGTIVARATISNTDRSLLPGQYVRIRLAIGSEPDALMVPETALGSSQLGKYVYVVGEGNKADQRLVSTGASHDGLIAIRKGVSEGERVINGNLQKIGPGVPVRPLP